jgi:hypothetical protein
MNRQEVAKLVTMANAAYPGRLSSDQLAMTVDVWLLALKDVPAPLAESAFTIYVQTATFFPSPGQIRTIALDQAGLFPTADEAWAMTRLYFRRASARSSIPEIVNEAAALVGGWRWLGQQDETDTRVAEQFRKAYSSLVERRLQSVNLADELEKRTALADESRQMLTVGDA